MLLRLRIDFIIISLQELFDLIILILIHFRTATKTKHQSVNLEIHQDKRTRLINKSLRTDFIRLQERFDLIILIQFHSRTAKNQTSKCEFRN